MAEKKTKIKNVDEKKNENKFILTPHVTEKASMQSSANAYTFVVAKNASKGSLMVEIKKTYKVTPKAINITNLPRRKVFVRGKIGHQNGIKKAVVFLKKGDTITLDK
jgi:large subunit ribosomal protein L23